MRKKWIRESLLELIESEFPDYDPVVAMIQVAHEAESEELRFAAHKEVASYLYPKLKVLEVSETDSKKPVIFNLDFMGNQSEQTLQ